jgi:hypothetical protein
VTACAEATIVAAKIAAMLNPNNLEQLIGSTFVDQLLATVEPS